jgi:hypothetical protein
MRVLDNEQRGVGRFSLLQCEYAEESEQFIPRTEVDVVSELPQGCKEEVSGVQALAVNECDRAFWIDGLNKTAGQD